MMTAPPTSIPDQGRIRRLRYWIPILSLGPAALLAPAQGRLAAGLVAGSLLTLVNLLGTQWMVTRFMVVSPLTRVLFGLLLMGKLGLTGLAIYLLLGSGVVSLAGLLLGLSVLVIAIVFDIFLFPYKKGSEQQEET